MFSAYTLDQTYGWIATHRLPLDDAIIYCKKYREQQYNCPVALVPDGDDPTPYLRMAVGLPHYGSANPDARFPDARFSLA